MAIVFEDVLLSRYLSIKVYVAVETETRDGGSCPEQPHLRRRARPLPRPTHPGVRPKPRLRLPAPLRVDGASVPLATPRLKMANLALLLIIILAVACFGDDVLREDGANSLTDDIDPELLSLLTEGGDMDIDMTNRDDRSLPKASIDLINLLMKKGMLKNSPVLTLEDIKKRAEERKAAFREAQKRRKEKPIQLHFPDLGKPFSISKARNSENDNDSVTQTKDVTEKVTPINAVTDKEHQEGSPQAKDVSNKDDAPLGAEVGPATPAAEERVRTNNAETVVVPGDHGAALNDGEPGKALSSAIPSSSTPSGPNLQPPPSARDLADLPSSPSPPTTEAAVLRPVTALTPNAAPNQNDYVTTTMPPLRRTKEPEVHTTNAPAPGEVLSPSHHFAQPSTSPAPAEGLRPSQHFVQPHVLPAPAEGLRPSQHFAQPSTSPAPAEGLRPSQHFVQPHVLPAPAVELSPTPAGAHQIAKQTWPLGTPPRVVQAASAPAHSPLRPSDPVVLVVPVHSDAAPIQSGARFASASPSSDHPWFDDPVAAEAVLRPWATQEAAAARQRAAQVAAEAEKTVAKLMAAQRQAAQEEYEATQRAAQDVAKAQQRVGELVAAQRRAAQEEHDALQRAAELIAAQRRAAQEEGMKRQRTAEEKAEAQQRAAEQTARFEEAERRRTALEQAARQAELLVAEQERAVREEQAAQQRAAQRAVIQDAIALKQRAAQEALAAQQIAARLLNSNAEDRFPEPTPPLPAPAAPKTVLPVHPRILDDDPYDEYEEQRQKEFERWVEGLGKNRIRPTSRPATFLQVQPDGTLPPSPYSTPGVDGVPTRAEFDRILGEARHRSVTKRSVTPTPDPYLQAASATPEVSHSNDFGPGHHHKPYWPRADTLPKKHRTVRAARPFRNATNEDAAAVLPTDDAGRAWRRRREQAVLPTMEPLPTPQPEIARGGRRRRHSDEPQALFGG